MKHQVSPKPARNRKTLPLALVALLAICGLSITVSQWRVASDDRITTSGAGQAMPYFNLQEGKDVPVEIENEPGSLFLQQRATGRPLALAQGDFDADGAPDLLAAYGGGSGGEIVLHRGNPEAIAPSSQETLDGMLKGQFPTPFRKKARRQAIPEAPDFLGTGDFNRDGYQDAVAAALGSDSIFILDNNGKGKFGEARRLTVPGRITAFMSGDFARADGLNDLLVAVSGPEGPQLLVIDGASGAWPVISAAYRLPGEVTAMAIGALSREGALDLAVASGNSIFIIPGHTRKMLEEGVAPLDLEFEEIRVDAGVRAFTIGHFIWDRAQHNEIAVMTGSGEIQILGRAGLDTRPFTEEEEARILKTVNRRGVDIRIINEDLNRLRRELTAPAGDDARGWQVYESHQLNAAPPARANAQSLMFATRLSGADTFDLVVADAGNAKLHFIIDNLERNTSKEERRAMARRPRQPVLFDVKVESGPVAALSMRMSVDTQPDIVVLREDASAPTAMLVLPMATFNVTTTMDNPGAAPGSLRTAVKNANNSPGADMIVVPAGTYTLNLGPDDDDIGAGTGNNPNGGDLDVLDTDGNGIKDGNLTVVGAGAASTVIRWAAANRNKIFDIDPDPFGLNGGNGLDFSISGVTLENGFAPLLDPNDGAPPPPFLTEGGAIRHLGFNSSLPGADGKLTVTNCVIRNSIASGPGGGIYTVHSAMDISGTTITGNNTGLGNGGGIFHGGGTSPMAIALTVTSSTISNNEAGINVQDGNSGGRGAGAVVLATVELPNHTISFSGCTISGNIAESFGGGIDFEVGSSLSISNTTISGNTARTNGGGIFTSAGATMSAGSVTFNSVNLQNNTADSDNNGSGNGGGLYHDRGAFNMSGGTISGNTAMNGGGIYDTLTAGTSGSDTMTLTNVTISGNSARGNGGGIAAEDPVPADDQNIVNISGCTIVSNTADSDNNGSGTGGGLFVSGGTVNVQSGTMIGNTGQANDAQDGGGIGVSGGTLTVAANVTIRNNTATGTGARGGGVYVGGGTATLTGPIQILNNQAPGGGGVAVNNGTATLSEINFTGNTASTNGGAVLVSGGTLNMTFSRLVGNTSPAGTGRGVHRTGGTANAENNWWGCNAPPSSGVGCDNTVGTVDADPQLVLRHTANPMAVLRGGCTTTLTASFLTNSAGQAIAVSNLDVLIGLPVTFNGAVLGTISSPQPTIQANGTATATFTTGPNGGNGSANATVDNGTATADIIVQEPPAITCPSDFNVNNDPGVCGASVTFAATATGFPVPTLTYTVEGMPITSPHVFPIGTTTVTATASNGVHPDATCASLGTAPDPTCTFTVTVTDIEDPVITCPSPITQSTDAGVCAAIVNFTVEATDNCPDVMVESTPASGSTFPLGTTTVTATATDVNGRTATCSFTVTIVDETPPVVTCPEPIVTAADPGACSAVVTFTPTATDNCPGEVNITSSPPSGSTFPVGVTTVTVTATDAQNNQAQCTFTVTVNDTEPPQITCPVPITTSTSPSVCGAVVNFTVNATDNCPGVMVVASPASGSTFPVGTTTVTATATDAAGNTANCMFTVTVIDQTPPQITCPAPILVATDAGQPTAVVNFMVDATDECPGVMVVASPASGTAFPIGTTTVMATATDASGNTANCSFTVTVEDQTPPMITCPAPIVTGNDMGACSAVVNFTVNATDNAPGVMVVANPPSGSAFPVGTTTVMATATDASGNTANCSFTVTVNDVQPPSVTCPAPIIQSTDPGVCTAVVNFMVNATDNCPGVMVVANPASGSAFPVGTTTVMVTATDASGNMSNCSFTVTVNDNTPPMITCPVPIVVNNDMAACSAVVTFTPEATDNCPGTISVVASPASGTAFPVGTTTVMVTATDPAGNMSNCSFTVTVNDNTPPMITCPAPIVVNNDADLCGAVVNFTVNAKDNCPGVSVVANPPSGTVFPVGTTTVTATATDASGNTANCSFTVTVNDAQPPSIICPMPITMPAEEDLCTAVVNYTVTAGDNCPGVSLVVNPPSGSTFPVGVTTVTATATDASGNMASCMFTVTIVDTQPPQLTCPPSITAPPGVVMFDLPEATDNCDIVEVVAVPPSGSTFPVGVTTVTVTATDPAGNMTSCTFLVATFDICLQDDSHPSKVFLFDSNTGDYLVCCDGVAISGKGIVTKKGCTIQLKQGPGDGPRRINVTVENCQKKGTAVVQLTPGVPFCQITDRDTTNNNCVCEAQQQTSSKKKKKKKQLE